ncbi:MAG: type III-B CRISPR module RAMP protein Cmr4 [Saprospiraceae bacterium]|nr:type III-B CRISPR module RAMP protein Cmr4 [Saprospiraceae bacterium]
MTIWIEDFNKIITKYVKTLFIYTESPLHAGIGAGLGAVDLPIQREQTTRYPMIQGSGVKGALRSQSTAPDDDKKVVFGPDNQPDFAGAAAFGDARILLFPVRALNGVFVWTTCESIFSAFLCVILN